MNRGTPIGNASTLNSEMVSNVTIMYSFATCYARHSFRLVGAKIGVIETLKKGKRKSSASVVLSTKNKSHMYEDISQSEAKAGGKKKKKKHAVAHWGEVSKRTSRIPLFVNLCRQHLESSLMSLINTTSHATRYTRRRCSWRHLRVTTRGHTSTSTPRNL